LQVKECKSNLEQMQLSSLLQVHDENERLERSVINHSNAKQVLEVSYQNYEKNVQYGTATSSDFERVKALERTMIHWQNEEADARSQIANNAQYRAQTERTLFSEIRSAEEANTTALAKYDAFETKQLLGANRSFHDVDGRRYTEYMDDDMNVERRVYTDPPVRVDRTKLPADYYDDPEAAAEAQEAARDGEYNIPEDNYEPGMFDTSDDYGGNDTMDDSYVCRKAASDECFKDVGWNDDAKTEYPGSANTSYNAY